MLKWTVRVVVALVLLLVAGGVVVYLKMDEVIRAQVEQQSAKQLQLGTSLAKADFKPLKGNLQLSNYAIENPQGFTPGKLLELGGLEVQVGYSQLRQDPVRIDAITIDSPRMLLEHRDGQFNLKAMVDRMNGGGQAPAPAPAPQPGPPQPPQSPQPQPQPAPPAEEAKQMKLIIGKITVKSPVVVLRPNLPVAGLLKEQIEIPIETFTLENIGNDGSATNGAALKQVVTQLVTTMAAKANASDLAKQVLSPELQRVLEGDLTAVAERAIPGEAGKVVSQLVKGNVLKDPDQLKANALGVAEQGLRNLGGGSTTQPLGQVGSFAADALGNAIKKDDKKKEDKKKDEKREKK